MTDTHYGPVDSNGKLTLAINHTLVWVISWLAIPCQSGRGGPIVITPSDAPVVTAGHFLCDQYAFVDATTGKFLIGYSEGHHSLPSALPADATAEVRAALLASGVTIVDARETTSTSSNIFACLSPVQTFQFDQEPQQATFRPGEKPPIDVLVFASVAQRQAAQHQISADGTGLNGARCGTIIDWVATPHWVGGGRYLLLVVSNDAALAARVAAAAARLGPP